MKKSFLQIPIKIWYKALPKLPNILWPIIGVRLSHNGISLPQPFNALVDSGANRSILHPLVAETIGFNITKLGPPKKGGLSASGEYESWILPELINVDIYGYAFRLRFTVINNPKLIWPCILGGDSIFEVARIDFQKFKGYFEMQFRTDIN